jgi:hypothetical protein
MLALIAVAALITGTPAFADDTHHPDKDKPAAAAQAAPQPAQSAKAKDSAAMMDNMKTMQEQMQKLRATTDPKEREKLLAEHMQTMQQTIAMMHDMGGSTMCDQMLGGMHDRKASSGSTEKPMDMMQMMMQQMMEHQQAMQGPAK